MELGAIRKVAQSARTTVIDHPEGIVGTFGAGLEIEGTVKAPAGELVIDSAFKGSVSSDGTISVGQAGNVEAELQARVIVIGGRFRGTLRASERVEIKEAGRAEGEIYTPVLAVEPGGFLDGQCHMPSPEKYPNQQLPTSATDVTFKDRALG